MHAAQGGHSRALDNKILSRALTKVGNGFIPRAIRADVGLAGSGRRVLEFAPNKVRHSTLIHDRCTHDALHGYPLFGFGSFATTGGSIRFCV